MSHITPSSITAFLYAGALQHPTKGDDYEDWEGHTGFVFYCEEYAHAIAMLLETRLEDEWPGVILYELIEPMGEWLIGHAAPLDTDTALEHFKVEYEAWIGTTAERWDGHQKPSFK